MKYCLKRDRGKSMYGVQYVVEFTSEVEVVRQVM